MFKNHIESFAKYAGVATVCTEWTALLIYYIQLPEYFGGKYPISDFATFPQTRLVFNICYSLAAFFYWIFIRLHIHKYYRAPLKIFTLSMILFVAIALVPYNPTNHMSALIHDTLGWAGATLFAISMYVIAKNSHNKLIYRVSLITIILSLILLVAFANVPKDNHLIFAFEAGSWLIWQIWILWISYCSYGYNVLKK